MVSYISRVSLDEVLDYWKNYELKTRGGAARPFDRLLPYNAEWWNAEIVGSDLEKLLLINSGDWRNLTDETLKPLCAARRIRKELSLREGVYKDQVNFILTHFETCSDRFLTTHNCRSKSGTVQGG